MSFNNYPFNATPYNETDPPILGTLGGSLVDVEQVVAISLSGSLMNIEQEVQLLETVSGSLVDVEQSIRAEISGSLVSIEQRVWDTAATNRLARRGYDCQIFLDGYEIPADELIDQLEIEFTEDAAATCKFTLYPDSGAQDISFYYGKSVIVNLTKPNKTTYRVFTGVVDIVDVDIIDNKTTLECTNRRKELLDAIDSPFARFGTPYDVSYLVSAEGSNSDIIERLLPYAPKSLDFDAYNNWYYTSWTPKSTADITLASSAIFRRDPTINLVYRGRIVNKVNIEFTYQFKRLHYIQPSYSWQAPFSKSGNNFGNLVLVNGYTLTKRDTIVAAVLACGWPLKGKIDMDGLPAPGWYGGIAWIGDSKQQSSSQSTDVSGDTITDSNGNSIIRTNTLRNYDADGVHATAAGFDLAYRWSQDIQKKYTLTVQSTTSQAVFGVIDRDSSYNIVDEYDDSRWTDNSGAVNSFAVTPTFTATLNANLTTDASFREGLAQSNILAAIDKAKTEILKSHRENIITCQTDMLPEVQLFQTLEVAATGKLQGKGKVSAYRHIISFSEADAFTEFEISTYYLGTGGSDTALALPSISTPNKVSYPSAPVLGSRYGVDPDTPGNLKRAGWFGNKWKAELGAGVRTQYKEQFRVDTPAIPSELVSGAVFSGTGSYNISIPTGTVTITYD